MYKDQNSLLIKSITEFHCFTADNVNFVHFFSVASSLSLSLYHIAFIEYLLRFILILELLLFSISTFGCVNAITYVWRSILCEQFLYIYIKHNILGLGIVSTGVTNSVAMRLSV